MKRSRLDMTPPIATATEKPVFAATTRARPRALKLVGRVCAGVVGLWLVALVLGTLGFSQVAGIPLPSIGGGVGNEGEAARKSFHPAASARPTPRARVTLTNRHAGGGVIAGAHRRGPMSGSNPDGVRGGRAGTSRPQ